MNCTQCQAQLYEYLDGTVSDGCREEISTHLAACPACAACVAAEHAANERFTAAASVFDLAPAARTRLAALLREPQPARFNWWRVFAPVAAAAGIVVLVGRLHHAPRPPAAVPAAAVAAYEPVEARDFILAARPAGIGHTADGVPYRFLRCFGVRREVWKKTADGSEVTVMVPHEQVLIAKLDVY